MISHEIVKAGNDYTVEVVFDGISGKDSLGSDKAVYEENRLKNLDVKNPEGPETDEAKL
jgi:2-hydroxy-3-keto-5-methylthiopentenyl-1-phosphate phosphatase